MRLLPGDRRYEKQFVEFTEILPKKLHLVAGARPNSASRAAGSTHACVSSETARCSTKHVLLEAACGGGLSQALRLHLLEL